jgi:hypothetical protein
VFFKCGNGTFSGVDMVVMWWDQLDDHLVGSDVLLNCLGALVVHHVQCRLVIASTDYCKHFGEDSNEQGVSVGWHWSHNDGIKVIAIWDKDILHVLGVASARAAKQKHILDHAGFVGGAHPINFGLGKDNVSKIVAC